jgi:hypothetical protein
MVTFRLLPAAALLALPAFAHAVNVDPGQTITLTQTTPSPFFTQTRIDHKESTLDLIIPYAGDTVTSYKQLTVKLVTNVYRNSGGTLAFAYNISCEDFPTPSPGNPQMLASIPSLTLNGLGAFTVDAHAENIPDGAPSGPGNPKSLTVTRSADGESVKYLFTSNSSGQVHLHNTLFPPQLELRTPAVVFVQTDATDYADFDGASVDIHSFAVSDPANFTPATLTFASFAAVPVTGQTPGIPEPVALATLPLALVALALRKRGKLRF